MSLIAVIDQIEFFTLLLNFNFFFVSTSEGTLYDFCYAFILVLELH